MVTRKRLANLCKIFDSTDMDEDETSDVSDDDEENVDTVTKEHVIDDEAESQS